MRYGITNIFSRKFWLRFRQILAKPKPQHTWSASAGIIEPLTPGSAAFMPPKVSKDTKVTIRCEVDGRK